MKLRMRGDSVRLRLTRGEVARPAAEGLVEEARREEDVDACPRPPEGMPSC